MLRSDGAYVQFDWHFGFRFLESMTAKLESVNQIKTSIHTGHFNQTHSNKDKDSKCHDN